MRIITSGEGFWLDKITEVSVVYEVEMGTQSAGRAFSDISPFLGSKARSSG
jgi:hypothetical protein